MLRLCSVGIFATFGVLGCSDDAPGGAPGAAGSGGTVAATGGSGAGTGGSGVSGGGAASGGSSGTAGTGGSGQAGGTSTGGGGQSGSGGGSGGTGGSGGAPSTMSAGCNKDNEDDPNAWTQHDIVVNVDPMFSADFYKNRRYWTRPPKNYDKTKPIALTFWGQGCGQGNGPEPTPLSLGPAADVSIQVELLAPQGNSKCYSAGPDGDNANSPELPYFDAVLKETLDNFCVDTSKIYMGGYSSGGWLTALVSCNRGSVVRGAGWAAAGLQKNHAACEGPVAALITRGTGDGGTPLDQAEQARDSFILRNGCTTQTQPWLPGETTFDSSSCVAYQGCMPGYPVVWCPTPGGHSNGLDSKLTSFGLWKLWSSL